MTEKGYQGRVQSLMQLSFAGFGIAALPLGALAEVVGLRVAIAVMGSVALAAMLAYALLERASIKPEPGAGMEVAVLSRK